MGQSCGNNTIASFNANQNELLRNATSQTKQYVAIRSRTVSTFFETLMTDPDLKKLSQMVPRDGFPGETTQRFYNVLSGAKSETKLRVLNKCLVKYCLTSFFTKNGSRDIQPNTACVRLKMLFSAFRVSTNCVLMFSNSNFI